MRSAVARAAAVLALVAAGPVAAPAADLDYTGHLSTFSCGEPWATKAERPPRIGRWYWTEPVTPTVNWLVPCHAAYLRPTPWTPAWIAYCEQKWPSFNPRTGYVMTPDGPRRCF